jgi:hypothetical protein
MKTKDKSQKMKVLECLVSLPGGARGGFDYP